MTMKKSLLAMLALGSVAGMAHADITLLGEADKAHLDVYGVLDAMYGNQQHSYGLDSQFPGSTVIVGPYKIAPTAAGATAGSVSGLMTGGISPDRIGFKGELPLSDRLKAFAVLETGFDITSGRISSAGGCMASNGGSAGKGGGQTTDCANSSINGQIDNRQGFVGLADSTWGSLAYGRNYAPEFDIASVYDPVQYAQLFSPLGFSGTLGGGGGFSEDMRVDNSFRYKNKIGAFNFGLFYKLNDSINYYESKTAWGANAGYEEGRFGVQYAYEQYTDGKKSTIGAVPDQLGVAIADTTSWMLAGKYKVTDAATLKVGYSAFTLKAPSDLSSYANNPFNSGFYGYTVSAVNYFTNNGKATGTALADQTTDILWFGGDYNFTDKLNVAAGYFDIMPKQSSDLGQKNGSQKYYSLLVDYHYTPTLDTYVGLVHMTFSGDAYPTTGAAAVYTTNQLIGIGGRYKF